MQPVLYGVPFVLRGDHLGQEAVWVFLKEVGVRLAPGPDASGFRWDQRHQRVGWGGGSMVSRETVLLHGTFYSLVSGHFEEAAEADL
ncbi:hypothetical protein AAFF_G00355310 [Aldrovandia affinis]|uniref:Uncharacterized protein n=1 Tax=Aldrovandia affinis TaxID=143900 RepID=A0AAD7SIS7_9TELE|nr:hypothetical protein AAFF_G00355310 [Aldrovandia affinis]